MPASVRRTRFGSVGMRLILRSTSAGPEETRALLLGHKTRSMPTHYTAAELAELLAAVNRIDRSLATPAITLLRAAA